jgi:hypothetical protein
VCLTATPHLVAGGNHVPDGLDDGIMGQWHRGAVLLIVHTKQPRAALSGDGSNSHYMYGSVMANPSPARLTNISRRFSLR